MANSNVIDKQLRNNHEDGNEQTFHSLVWLGVEQSIGVRSDEAESGVVIAHKSPLHVSRFAQNTSVCATQIVCPENKT